MGDPAVISDAACYRATVREHTALRKLEAALFAGDLFRMYSRYCEAHGWKVHVMSANETSLDGYKEILFTVEGDGAYGAFRFESGGHRVQRVPETEAQGRIHTSGFAAAATTSRSDEWFDDESFRSRREGETRPVGQIIGRARDDDQSVNVFFGARGCELAAEYAEVRHFRVRGEPIVRPVRRKHAHVG